MTNADMNRNHNPNQVHLDDDGEGGRIEHFEFRDRTLHRLLNGVEREQRPLVVSDVLTQGAELLTRAGRHGDLEQFAAAVGRLDGESSRIVTAATDRFERIVLDAIEGMAASLQGDDGPLKPVLNRFDPSTKGNVIDLFREVITSTAATATRDAVKELAETTAETTEKLAKSVATLDRVAAAELARLDEASRGTAKGITHELTVESLLGDLVSVAGDGLDDVSTVLGLLGTKKGDKLITPNGGVPIVTEEKCSQRYSESKIRALLNESMANRGAKLAMMIVEDESKVPGNRPFHLIDRDKIVVVAEPVTLRLVYCLFRAKSVELAVASYSAEGDNLTATVEAIREHVDELERVLKRFRELKTEHTKAAKAIKQSESYAAEMATMLAESVSGIMAAIVELADSDQEAA
jgi:hypothetical protein